MDSFELPEVFKMKALCLGSGPTLLPFYVPQTSTAKPLDFLPPPLYRYKTDVAPVSGKKQNEGKSCLQPHLPAMCDILCLRFLDSRRRSRGPEMDKP